jgi:hypothetical protein
MLDMTPATFPLTGIGVVRCECPNCGIHAMGAMDPETDVRCPNCGSRDLIAIGVEPLHRARRGAGAPPSHRPG